MAAIGEDLDWKMEKTHKLMSETESPVLVFATHNENKAKEVQQMLRGIYQIKTLSEIGCFDDIPETADTLEGNARLKARYVNERFGLDCFADDTGLEVDALGGAPGVRTARYAGDEADAQKNMSKLLQALGDQPLESRGARFRTSICLIQQGHERYFEGVCSGHIAESLSGTQGFGYDPVFVPDGFNVTFAEMSSDQKNELSHRGLAVRKMVNDLLASSEAEER